jgi:hypothetical protein
LSTNALDARGLPDADREMEGWETTLERGVRGEI